MASFLRFRSAACTLHVRMATFLTSHRLREVGQRRKDAFLRLGRSKASFLRQVAGSRAR